MVERTEVKYAVAGSHHIAYRVLTGEGDGDREGDRDIVMVSGGSYPMDALPDDPLANRLLEGLASLGRLVVFDRRGIGLSDQITDWDRAPSAQWAEDLAAVIDASGVDAPVVFSWAGQPVARTYALRHPGRIRSLILFNVNTLIEGDEVDPIAFRDIAAKGLDGPILSEAFFPERWKDPVFREWHDAAGRAGASPGQAARLFEFRPDSWDGIDHAHIDVATFVISRTPPAMPLDVPHGYYSRPAQLIRGATLADLGEGSYVPFGAGVDDVLAEVTRFITGEARLPAPERSLAAILFTDVVGSTRRAIEVGDGRWKALLDRHDEASANAIRRHGGELVKSTGDGVLAIFGSTTAAIRSARDITRDLASVDLSVRSGIHVGQVDRRGDDVSGIALNIAARIMSGAQGDQVLVSDVVERVTDDVTFVTAGEHELKDLDGTWHLFEVV
jgi:class 3 adenylate cyclase